MREVLKKRILILTQCNNLSSDEFNELRASLSKSQVQIKLIKTSLFRKAVDNTPFSGFESVLKGPIVVWSSDSEPGDVGKAIVSTIKNKINIHLLAAKMDDQIWTHEGCVEFFQTVPKHKDLYSQLLNLLQSPAISVNSLLDQIPNSLGNTLKLVGQ